MESFQINFEERKITIVFRNILSERFLLLYFSEEVDFIQFKIFLETIDKGKFIFS